MKKNNKITFFRIRQVLLVFTLMFLFVPTNHIEVDGADSKNNIMEDIRVGWNLGNTLDSYNANKEAYEIAVQKRNKYQLMMVYTTKRYSGWDASPAMFINSDGSEYIAEWNIQKINSDMKLQNGAFSLQMINQDLNESGTSTLDFTVTKAEFQMKNGTVIKFNDFLGDYSKSISKKVTEYISIDLTNEPKLKIGSDILGGKLTIGIKVNRYPYSTTKSISKEQYYETLWGNPTTTKRMIDDVKAAGFEAIRIPVTYYNHISENGTIDQEWLNRIRELVQYVIDNDLYCIINVHHDTGEKGWLKADSTVDIQKFQYIWQQISNQMNDFDHKLLFEGYNELLNSANKWSWADDVSYKAANDLNQAFVDIVRSTGGNNAQRALVVNTYASSAEEKEIKAFVLPKDSIENRLIVQVHYYGTSEKGITAVVDRLNKYFVSKGIPAIIGEVGMSSKFSEEERSKYANLLVSSAKQRGVTVFWWDDGNGGRAGVLNNYGLYDRYSLKWHYPKIAKALVDASK